MYISKKYAIHDISERELRPMTSNEFPLFLLTLLLWSDRILLSYVRALLLHLPFVGSAVDPIIITIYVVLIIMALPKILGQMKGMDVVFGVAVILACLLNFVLFPENKTMLKEQLPTFLFYTFPLYYIGISLDYDRVYPWLYRLSAITVAAFVVYKLFIGESMDEVQSIYHGDMWGSYNFLPHVGMVAMGALKKPTIANVSLSVLGITMISLLGSRGPLVCIVLAIGIYLIAFKKFKYPTLTRILIVVGASVILLSMHSVMSMLETFAKNVGLSVRVFATYLDEEFIISDRRGRIAKRLYAMIAQKPFFGHGLYADRVALRTYAHNIAIELWHAFGVVYGTGILGVLVIVLMRVAFAIKRAEKYALLIIPLFVAGFIKLFMSGSFLDEIYLYWFLGVSVRLCRDNARR